MARRRKCTSGGTQYEDAWIERVLELPSDAQWYLLESSCKAAEEHDVETRLAIANGAFGMRASLEQPRLTSRAVTLFAGLFETPDQAPRVPALVITPDWLRLGVLVDGEPVSLDNGETLVYWRALDLRRGLLVGDWRQRTRDGRVVCVRRLRLASLARRDLAIQLAHIAVDETSVVTLETDVQPTPCLQLVGSADGLLEWRTPSGSSTLVTAIEACAQPAADRAYQTDTGGRESWSWTAVPGQSKALMRLAALVPGDHRDSDPSERALASLRWARRKGLAGVLANHVAAWAKRWTVSDIEIDGDSAAQRALRFAVYHLVSAANPENEHVSIGARGLSGEGYLGHVFWDTDIFLLPFYTLTWPEAARAALMYRYHTLPAARAKAERLGYRGALYAWESADTGEEVTPTWALGPDGRVIPILNGTQEQHISADIAYAVWQYWQATRDVSFLLEAGAEILLDTTRFWASRALLEADGRYHIRGVIGPDEYHDSVDDNAYTNGLAAWNLRRGLMIATSLRSRWPRRWDELSRGLELSESELRRWQEVADRLATGFDPVSGLFEQFAGFFGLEYIDLRDYASQTVPLDVVLGPERTRRAQVIKQPDALMLLALLPEEYDRRVLQANFRYYEPRCGHGSSLSPAVHALLAARLGNMELAERFFRQAAAIDLEATRGDSALGVHMGALGGLWQAAVFGFGGLTLDESGVQLEPHLPAKWRRLAFNIRWRGRMMRFDVRRDPDQVSAWLAHGPPLGINVHGDRRRLSRGEPVVWQGEELIE